MRSCVSLLFVAPALVLAAGIGNCSTGPARRRRAANSSAAPADDDQHGIRRWGYSAYPIHMLSKAGCR